MENTNSQAIVQICALSELTQRFRLRLVSTIRGQILDCQTDNKASKKKSLLCAINCGKFNPQKLGIGAKRQKSTQRVALCCCEYDCNVGAYKR